MPVKIALLLCRCTAAQLHAVACALYCAAAVHCTALELYPMWLSVLHSCTGCTLCQVQPTNPLPAHHPPISTLPPTPPHTRTSHPPPAQVYQSLTKEGTFEGKLTEIYAWGNQHGWEPVVHVNGRPQPAAVEEEES
jgi:hypothetical protein